MGILTVNAGLALAGKSPIPFDENAFTDWLSVGLAAASMLWNHWKDAPYTNAGQEGHARTKALKEDGIDPDEEGSEA